MGIGMEKRERRSHRGLEFRIAAIHVGATPRSEYRAVRSLLPEPSTTMDARKLLTFFPNIVPLFSSLFSSPHGAIVGHPPQFS